MSDLIEASIDLLMIENPKHFITIQIEEDYHAEVDFELYTLTIKNLLDNAIKYSKNKHVTIIITKKKLQIINQSEPLPEPLENYFEPFHASKKGLGLGLYIVKSILDIHQSELHYDHKEGKNIFTVS